MAKCQVVKAPKKAAANWIAKAGKTKLKGFAKKSRATKYCKNRRKKGSKGGKKGKTSRRRRRR